MSCLRPRVGVQYYGVNKNGKEVKKMRFYSCSGLEYRDFYRDSVTGLNLPNDFAVVGTNDIFDKSTGELMGPFLVPCGHCQGCYIDRARSWAARVVMEMEKYPNTSYFVTLTYDIEKLPENLRDKNGCLLYPGIESTFNSDGALTLRKDHLQRFFKRIRKCFPGANLRYFAAGEYGSKSLRPHFHICMMGLPLDLIPFGTSQTGHPLYRSPILEKEWPCGFVSVAPLNFSTAAYTARYCQKKALGKDTDYYKALNLEPEFTLMSRKPGLGTDYVLDHPEIFKTDGTIILPAVSKDKASIITIPRFFMDKAKNDKEFASDYFRIKDLMRKQGLDLLGQSLAMSEFDEENFFKVRERKFEDSYKKLVRSL